MKNKKARRWEIQNFHKFIFVVFVVKVVFMGLFSSDYQNEMFEQFVFRFFGKVRDGGFVNPYDIPGNTEGIFPYPPMMFLIECAGGFLKLLFGKNLFLSNLSFKLPNLLFDCLGLRCLVRMFPEKRKYSAVIYFASPIILYASYMHGQLDIIPTVLCFMAICSLTAFPERSELKYMLCLFLALSCKLHILAVIPVLFLFVWKRDGWKKAIYLHMVPLLLTVLLIIPFGSRHFFDTVIMNSDQKAVLKTVFSYGDIEVYVPILAIVAVYLKVYTISKINKELLYSLCGILFSVFLVLVAPMPGWYVWGIPYITIFFIDREAGRHTGLAIYIALNAAYLCYFVFAHRTGYTDLYFMGNSLQCLKYGDPVFVNSIFTVLTAVLAYTIYLMYQSGVASNSLYRRGDLSFTIGISGDSGSGKSTMLGLLKDMLGEGSLLYLEGDGDHKWERGNAMWKYFTHLNPKANYIYRQAEALAKLRMGQSVERADYDHGTGKFTNRHKISPKPFIVLCGLHALYLPQVRNNLDLKIYMDAEETLRRYWKVHRDTGVRGYSRSGILGQIEERAADAEKYIYPQKKYADIVFQYFDETLDNCLEEKHEVSLSLKVTLSASIELEEFIQMVEGYGVCVEYDYDEGLERQMVIFTGDRLGARSMPVRQIAERLVPQLDEIVSWTFGAKDNLGGIVELLLLLEISRKMRGGGKSMMRKAVIFDLDDTLYDYSSLHERALEAVFADAGKRLSCTEEAVAQAFGLAREEVKACLGQTASAHNRMLYFQKTLEHLQENPLSYALEMYDSYWNYMLDNMVLYDGVLDILHTCREKRIKVGICTDMTAYIQHRKLRKLGIAAYISALVTSEEAGCEKPAQEVFGLILRKLHVLPQEALYVGDSFQKDIAGAGRSGMETVWLGREEKEGAMTARHIGEIKELLL